ncbi:uncharacterized protein LOC110453956 isoform X2 [Mizuhopecten yessoensis]|uniref:uncharacterized protein LOC110453956 isoform X2 n=1 Tax=Mizuhopecten yessoensis TaxID=6573 RepID=UPI000B457287|nr:uncharacterized protein LOC110453956 isoform X2 [Mizuhopecten yessoensis]
MSTDTHSGTDTLFYFLGTMYDVIQALVVFLLYAIAIVTVINAIRQRCKNRLLIIVCMVVGTSLQTVYLVAPYRTGFMDVRQHYSYLAGNVSDSLTGSRSDSGSANDFRFNKHTAYTKAMSTNLHGDVLVYRKQNEEITAGGYSNRKNAKILQGNKVPNTTTVTVKSSNNDQSFPDFRCADLRLMALVHYGVICMSLLLASVRQNVSWKRQTTVKCGVLLYVVLLIGTIALLYALKTSVNHEIFSFKTASDSFQLVVCSQDARSQFLPIFLETVCLFGPSIGMLLVAFYKKTDRRFIVFKECRAAHEVECTACRGLDDVLENVLMCSVFVLLGVRPFHYIFTFVKHTQFYDIWVIACVFVFCASISVTNVWNIISHKLDCKDSIPIEAEKSPGEKKNIADLV